MTPRITLAVLAYNQAAFIEDAVRSALAQACEPVEVLLSDDASTDDTFARMQALAAAYTGPHEVIARRNERNLGIGAHYNAIVRAARGTLVVTMAGDDLSTPDRVARTVEAWDATGGRADLVACHLIDMDHDGTDLGRITVDDLSQWPSVEHWARRRPYIVGAGHAFTRRLFDRFGDLRPGVAYEDQVFTLRAILAGGAVTTDHALVRYRRGGLSDAVAAESGAQLAAWTRKRTDQALALHSQWMADADTAGHAPTVAAAIRREHEREACLHALLVADGFAGRCRAVAAWPSVSLSWRLRKLFYWQWPGVAAAVRRRQVARRLRRVRGERR